MSQSYNRRKKERRKALGPEVGSVRNKIKRGLLPRFHFIKDQADKVVKRFVSGRAKSGQSAQVYLHAWRRRSTMAILCSDKGWNIGLPISALQSLNGTGPTQETTTEVTA